MTFEEIKQGEETYIMHTYGRFPIALDHGKGATLWDTDGKKYIDLTSGIGVNRLYEMTKDGSCPFVLWVGSKRLIKRKRFDQYIEQSFSI